MSVAQAPLQTPKTNSKVSCLLTFRPWNVKEDKKKKDNIEKLYLNIENLKIVIWTVKCNLSKRNLLTKINFSLQHHPNL